MRKPLIVLLVFVVTLVAAGQSDTPAFNPGPPAKGASLAPILTEQQLAQAGIVLPVQQKAYVLAPKISSVLYQQPCYCYCDRHAGHKSLRSCFESTHAANCGTCLQEAYYAYAETQKHKTPRQIREGIIRGDWKSIDLNTVVAQ